MLRISTKKLVVASMPDILKAALLALLVGSSTAAQAQGSEGNAAAALKSACRVDYRAHCSGNDPTPPIAAACLAQFYVNLSTGCRTALDTYNTPASETPDSTVE